MNIYEDAHSNGSGFLKKVEAMTFATSNLTVVSAKAGHGKTVYCNGIMFTARAHSKVLRVLTESSEYDFSNISGMHPNQFVLTAHGLSATETVILAVNRAKQLGAEYIFFESLHHTTPNDKSFHLEYLLKTAKGEGLNIYVEVSIPRSFK